MGIPQKGDGWGRIADYIISREQDGSWRHGLPQRTAFTAWGLAQARSIGISKYTFWQYRRAGLLYNQLLDTLPDWCQTPLRELTGVAPENLNELQKLSRVAPPQMLAQLATRVIVTKDITRKELRALWASLRPAMGGVTARGRQSGKSFQIRIAADDGTAQTELLNGLLLVALEAHAAEIFGPAPIVLDCRKGQGTSWAGLVDFVVVSGNFPNGGETHAVCLEWRHGVSDGLPALPGELLWLACLHNEGEAALASVPEFVGIIELELTAGRLASVRVRRRPSPGHVVHRHQDTIGLLAHQLRYKHRY